MAIIEHVEVKTGESTRTLKDLRGELKELRNQLLNTQQGTEEYNKTMVQAANIQHELREQMQEINASAMDFGQKLGNVTKAMAGISGAVTAATGALSLFGIENEEAQKKITATMTTLIGITEGLAKMDDGVKAFKRLSIAVNTGTTSLKGFKVALASTGIGALVIVLGSVIANWKEFSAEIGLSAEKMQKFGDISKGVFNVFSESLRGIALALAKMLKGDFSGAWESLKEGFSVAKNFNEGVAKSAQAREDAITQAEAEAAAEREKIAKDEADKKSKLAEEAYRKRIELIKKLAAYERDMAAAQYRGIGNDKYTQEAYDRQMKYYDTLFAVYRKDSEEYRNLMLEKEQYLQDFENHALGELQKRAKYERDMAAAQYRGAESDRYTQESYDRQMKYFDDLFALYNQDSEEYRNLVLEKEQYLQDWDNHTLAQIQAEKDARTSLLDDFNESLLTDQQKLDARYSMLIDAATKEGQDTAAITKWYEDEKTRIIKEAQEEQDEIMMAKVKNYTDMAGYIGDIIGSLGDMMEEGTEEQKGLAIAATTIQTLVGVATALSGAFTTKSGVWDIAIAAAQAASIAASGIASIQKIRNVNKDGNGSELNTSYQVPSVDVYSAMNSSQDFGQTLDGAITQTAIKDQKVYVTEHDITETQNKVKVAQANAKY